MYTETFERRRCDALARSPHLGGWLQLGVAAWHRHQELYADADPGAARARRAR